MARSADSYPNATPNGRAPFAKGNTMELVHGASSPRMIAKRAKQVHKQILKYAPWLSEPQYLPSVERYLNAAARESLMHDHIIKVTAEKGTAAVPARMHEQAAAAARLAWTMATELGLTPRGHAELKVIAGRAVAAENGLFEDRVGYLEAKQAEQVVRTIRCVLTDLGIDDSPAVQMIVRERLHDMDAIDGSAEDY